MIYREPDQEPEPEENLDSDPDDLSESGEGSDTSSAGLGYESKTKNANKLNSKYDVLNGSESYLLHMLLKKMDIFDRLLKENKTAGAAMLANDINGIIADFDPQIYFPGLFAKFTKLFALNVEKLLAFNKCHDTVLWKSMEKLYKVDMETFVSMDDKFHFNDPDSFQITGEDENDFHQNGLHEDNDQDDDDDEDF